MSLVDSHCHLDFDAFAGELEDVVARARAAGVAHMVTICTSLEEFDRVHRVARRFDGITCSVGVHPNNVNAAPPAGLDALIALAQEDKVVAIGETGLDYYYDHGDPALQRESFRIHIEAARKTGLPLVVHSRNAETDTADILTEEMQKGAFTGVLHCFSSEHRLAEAALDIGFYISFSGILTFKNAEALRESARLVPADRLLVETDAPYLAPVPNRGKRNEPSFVAETARELARVRGMAVSEIEDLTTENFYRLFSKAAKWRAEARHGAAGDSA